MLVVEALDCGRFRPFRDAAVFDRDRGFGRRWSRWGEVCLHDVSGDLEQKVLSLPSGPISLQSEDFIAASIIVLELSVQE